jgi:NDP-sugar pyrophosphorylase family protein
MPPPLPWPALVLAAGLGTRFRPLSYVRAKPAAPVAGTPIVRRILAWLSAAGVRRVVVNLHHRPESIVKAVGDASALGLGVEYSWERARVLGSAGGPRKALPLLDAPRFLLVNGDTLCDVDLAAMLSPTPTRRAMAACWSMEQGESAASSGRAARRGPDTPACTSSACRWSKPRSSRICLRMSRARRSGRSTPR